MPNTSISFPTSPTAGQTYTYGSTTYTFDGSYWSVNGSSVDQVSTNDIQNGAVTPAKLSTGGPSWTSGGNLTITGDLTVDTDTLFVDSTNNKVGIRTTSPEYNLDLIGNIRIANNSTSGYGVVQYGRSTTPTQNWHLTSEGDGTFRFYNGNSGAGTELIRINQGGRVQLTTGQITFPATQISSGDANTLDDYEEGDWTPTVGINNSSVGITYTAQHGSYVKIGRLVFIQGRVILSNKGTNTGSVTIVGFPFPQIGPTIITGSGGSHGCLSSCYYAGCTSNVTSPPTGYLSGSGAVLLKSGAGAVSGLLDSDITSSFDLIFNAVYRTNT